MNELILCKEEKFQEFKCDIWKNNEENIFMTGDQLSRILGHKDSSGIRKTISRNEYLKNEEFSKVVTLRHPLGGNQETRVFTEDGIYEVTMISNTEKAKAFRKWFRELLKALRKGQAKVIFNEVPQTYKDAIVHLAEVLKINQQLEPKAEFAEKFMTSKNAKDMSEVCNILKCGMGRTKLFRFLRDNKILMGKPRQNIPYSQYSKYFKVIVWTDGNISKSKTLVTPEGVDFLHRLLKRKHKLQISA